MKFGTLMSTSFKPAQLRGRSGYTTNIEYKICVKLLFTFRVDMLQFIYLQKRVKRKCLKNKAT